MQTLTPADAARLCNCGACWAEPGMACTRNGDHLARYCRAWRRGLVSDEALGEVIAEFTSTARCR